MDLTPQQKIFLKHYLDPKSDTWSNGLQSAIKAGFSEEYAKVMMSRDLDWVSENVNDDKLLRKANKNLDLALDGGLDDKEKGGRPIQMRATELTLKGLQKSKWSERQELTGKDGKEIQGNTIIFRDFNDAQ